MALEHSEKEQFGLQIIWELLTTPYACSSLIFLSGGTANFLFRGVLTQPLQDGTKTIVIKHSKEFISVNRNFSIDVSRCLFEETMLSALNSFPSIRADNFHLRTPHLYQFDKKTNTQILEDLSNSVDVKTALVSSDASKILPQPISIAMGHALGVWLRTFHSWVSEPAQIDMQKTIGKNKSMRQLKYKISYGAFLGVIQKFPEIWERYSKVLEEVRDMAAAEYTESVQDNAENNWQIIHGDFWSGNILMPNTPSLEGPQPAGINIFIIDWELAQIGRIEYDLGQMIGDLYERKHFMNAHTALWMIQGFVFGYGVLSDDMAFRIAIHAGVHLICWYIRGNPAAPFTKPPEQIQDAMRIGTEFIVRGWTRDRAWFESSELACLFQERSKQA